MQKKKLLRSTYKCYFENYKKNILHCSIYTVVAFIVRYIQLKGKVNLCFYLSTSNYSHTETAVVYFKMKSITCNTSTL